MENKPVIRMSSAGKCPRALSAELLGYESTPAPNWLESAASEGRWHEQRIKSDLLTDEGFEVFDEQLEISLYFPSFTLLGHIDGKVYYSDTKSDDTTKLLEIKSMSQYEFDRWMKEGFAGFPHYAAQISCYMEATGLKECLYIVKNRNSGYINKRIISELPMPMTTVIARITDAVNHAMEKKLCPANFDPNSLECKRCEYNKLCIPEPTELTPFEDYELSNAAIIWREGAAIVKDGEALVNAARDIFEKHTKATGINKWQYSGLAINLVHVKETTTYPKAKLLKVFTKEELERAIEVKEAYDQLRITDLEKE